MRLENYCMLGEKELMWLLARKYEGALVNGYLFIDNKSKVLAVCHADISGAVSHDVDFAEGFTNRGRHYVRSGALDDRLGIWLLMEVLLDRANMDILITTGEEIGMSTASEFEFDYSDQKDYNWIVEFDRRGNDFVTYDFDNNDFTKKMQKCGIRRGDGSFSDICSLTDFGVMACNIGIGYHNEHSHNCYADLDDTMDQAVRFLKFYRKHYNHQFINNNRLIDLPDIDEDIYEGYRPQSNSGYGQRRLLW